MTVTIGENRYGKSRVRMIKVDRQGAQHRVFEWSVEVWLKGDFKDCFENGDNSAILPTDTMKNTVYSVGRDSKAQTMEGFAMELVRHFIDTQPQVDEAGAKITGTRWNPITAGGTVHGDAFVQSGSATDTTQVTLRRGGEASVASGVTNLVILKTAKSAFAGYLKDRLTTLKETGDRLLGTSATAEWKFATAHCDCAATRSRIVDSLLNAFARHDSLSVQQTLYAMGQAALAAAPEVSEIFLSMPNKHCNLVDLSAFGQDNPNCIFVPTDEPHGSIEAWVRREN